MIFSGKNIVVGVTGSIASYKSAELVRSLQKKGANVRVVLTPSAKEFIGELTFKALTNYQVLSDWKDGETGLEHIYWARWADSFVIAPASANTIAKLRTGISDNFLTSMVLAYDKPLVIAPAMNTKMYENPATKENLETLKKWGHIIVEACEGELACKEEGIGKLAQIQDIETQILYSLLPKPLKGKKVLITAGGTREYFDPIRYITNASSGRLGYSLAKVAYALGADVTLISAPTCLEKPYNVEAVDVVSAKDMFQEVIKRFKDIDIVIMNAAVADFRPKSYSDSKLKKNIENPTVEFVPNPDILKEIGLKKRKNQMIIGFAAESENLIDNALEKLNRKNLDVIVANDLNVFGKNTHTGYIIFKNEKVVKIPELDKESSALFILNTILSEVG
ncbi:MAG: bifunctional phosphopantothenoylcysteine decarboxylase/phosphopantothenate--cysteine ligase CoaBC [Aquificae bacterium]|nr:bifunctional phosphopantothenoylcysteine decarboxylase/phosphopantothenate--cysteine ligase CoaBC [Aquificota bacterium]